MNAEQAWGATRNILAEKVSETSMKAWFSDCRAAELENGCITLAVPGTLAKNAILTNFGDKLVLALSEAYPTQKLDYRIVTEDELKADRSMEAKKPSRGKPGYSFNGFIVGKSNEQAFRVSKKVAECPGKYIYNPLYIYGGSGLGKTHLLRAIENSINVCHPELNVVYTTCERFVNELVSTIKSGENESFRLKYRNCDVLLIDDIQQIMNKKATQQEIINTFETLYGEGKQIVFTSDCPLQRLSLISEQIRSRFESSLAVEITTPDLDTRKEIVKRKVSYLEADFSDEAVNIIAGLADKNVRQLEGMIKSVASYCVLNDCRATEETVKKVICSSVSKKVSPEEIIGYVSEQTGISKKDITGKKQKKEISTARHICIYLMRTKTGFTFEQIGEIFDKDHSSVSYSMKKAEELISSDRIIRNLVEAF